MTREMKGGERVVTEPEPRWADRKMPGSVVLAFNTALVQEPGGGVWHARRMRCVGWSRRTVRPPGARRTHGHPERRSPRRRCERRADRTRSLPAPLPPAPLSPPAREGGQDVRAGEYRTPRRPRPACDLAPPAAGLMRGGSRVGAAPTRAFSGRGVGAPWGGSPSRPLCPCLSFHPPPGEPGRGYVLCPRESPRRPAGLAGSLLAPGDP